MIWFVQVLCQWYLKCRNGELATLSELQLQGADHVLLQVLCCFQL